MRQKTLTAALAAIALAGWAAAVEAAETQIGETVEKNHLEITAVYLQPVMMEPMLPGMNMGMDMHLEADIRSLAKNPNGFGPGEWVPYLSVAYKVAKLDSDWKTFGTFMPMVANDGPHYGANVKLDGSGKYRLTYSIQPPPYAGMYRHTDEETGVGAWWEPFETAWDFTFVGGVGKKGGY